jgi:hypothetical protein
VNAHSQMLVSYDHATFVETTLRIAIEDNPNAVWNSAAFRIESELARAAVRDAHFLKSWSVAVKEEIFDTAQNRLLDELCRWIKGEPCDCGDRTFDYWVNRALNTARKTFINRAKRRAHVDVETTERCTFRIARRLSPDDESDAQTAFDRKTVQWLHPARRGQPEPRSFRTAWFDGVRAPKGFSPRIPIDARKIAIAERPADVRTKCEA